MKIERIILGGGLTGFYTDDKLAILKDAPQDGFIYRGKPLTAGFKQIRQPGESVLVMFVLEDGEVALGDCAGTQYSGSGGREPPFTAAAAIPLIEEYVVPRLVGRDIGRFRETSKEVDEITADGKPLHPAIRYGVTQAVLDTVARDKKITKAAVVADEYGTEVATKPIPIYAQTGDERYTNVDKMIIKRVDILPHGLINNVKERVGERGEKFLEYVAWVRERVKLLGDADYQPELHFDVYGTVGYAFDNDVEAVADYLGRCVEAASPFNFIIEMPIDLGSKATQLGGMSWLKKLLVGKGIEAELMIDEWCNNFDDLREWVDSGSIDRINVKTIVLGGIHNIVESILYCNGHGVGAMLGGTCNETDVSAMVMSHLAMAAHPQSIAGRPGMGVDEGVMTVYNEMVRIQSLHQAYMRRPDMDAAKVATAAG